MYIHAYVTNLLNIFDINPFTPDFGFVKLLMLPFKIKGPFRFVVAYQKALSTSINRSFGQSIY